MTDEPRRISRAGLDVGARTTLLEGDADTAADGISRIEKKVDRLVYSVGVGALSLIANAVVIFVTRK